MPADTAPDLRDLQKWLLTFITSHASDQQALQEAEAVGGLEGGSAERLILPSQRLTPFERLMIHRNQYLLRMMEALEIDFPSLRKYMGQARFFQLMEEYVKAHPSRSWTLDDLGRHFAEFVGQAAFLGRDRAFLQDLACMEWAMCELVHEPPSPTLTPADLAQLDPACFAEARFRPIAALRLVATRYPVSGYLRELDEGHEAPPRPRRRDSWNLLWNDVRFAPWRVELARPAYELLQALTLEGLPLGAAIEQTLRRRRVTQQQVFTWFQQWVREGLFSAVVTASPGSPSGH